MKRLLTILCAILVCIAIGYALKGIISHREPGEITLKDVSPGRWAKDSGAILYQEDGGKLIRYDPATSKRTVYSVSCPGADSDEWPYFPYYDISPDGKSIVYLAKSRDKAASIVLVDLASNRASEISTPAKPARGVFWLAHDRIAFTDSSGNICVVDLKGRPVVVVHGVYTPEIYACDGSGFIYRSKTGYRTHYFDLATGRDRLLGVSGQGGFVYLSSRMAILTEQTTSTVEATVLDLGTMTSVRVTLPHGRVSSDLSRCSNFSPGGGDWYNAAPTRLRIVSIPPTTVKLLRSIDKRHR